MEWIGVIAVDWGERSKRTRDIWRRTQVFIDGKCKQCGWRHSYQPLRLFAACHEEGCARRDQLICEKCYHDLAISAGLSVHEGYGAYTVPTVCPSCGRGRLQFRGWSGPRQGPVNSTLCEPLITAIFHRFSDSLKTCDTSNISVLLSHRKTCDIHFISQV